MSDFTKIVRIGVGESGSVFCSIEFKGVNLSISGVEGPTRNGNCKGACGQIVMHEWGISEYAPGWSSELESRLRDIWDKWHLNDMKAGSPAQQAWLAANPISDRLNHYKKACHGLADAGLNPDPGYLHNGKPYRYGSAWLREEVPAEVLDFLRSLPDTDITPAWV